MKIAIIGAGPAGLTIAHELSKNGIKVDVYDRANEVGGFARSISLWNKNVEIGPHFFNVTRFPDVRKLIFECLNGRFRLYARKTYVLTLNKLFIYPPAVFDVLKKLSPGQFLKASAAFIRQMIAPSKPDGSAAPMAKNLLGGYLYKHFFANFCRKIWSLNAGELSEVFVRSLIGLTGKVSATTLIIRKIKQSFGATKPKDEHIYPDGGFSTLWAAMQGKIESRGGEFFLSTTITELERSTNSGDIQAVVLNDGTRREYDMFVATIPVLPLLNYLKDAYGEAVKPQSQINFRNDVLVYMQVTYDEARPGQCFYIYDDKIRITRVTNFNGFDVEGDKAPFAVILVEYWCDKDDAMWQANDDELLSFTTSELHKTGLFTGLKVMDKVVKKVNNAFQIPDLDLPANQEILFSQLSACNNLLIAGRNASVSFSYGMENALNDGIILVNDLLPAIKARQSAPIPVNLIAQ
ncbi:NAD(P)-binding protein [Mucilaginibacter sp. JRF]|uniref:protoporphyrinogen/coproporphyrinogen oxidase n=1 Tax=Mucilaginibacter sp. JRF TaxID=2780088 RepID=UPI0018801468|nr:FAD-dependent oxidoreductase [Mucilaginibacter sp. JRF]MBE9584295.1 NAD(P)-binding protein [Mucilaginibacter sp. JRF]